MKRALFVGFCYWLVVAACVLGIVALTAPEQQPKADPIPAHYPTKGKGK